ncbi:MAG: GAF domain-containing protein [Anaerolineaceae bacterium]|nr:GAF domain-containing protein [Anaerolineaceae bacterium]
MIIQLLTGLMIIAIIGILWISIRIFISLKSDQTTHISEPINNINYSHPVMIIEKGGKVKYTSDNLLALFDIQKGHKLDLFSMSKKTKMGQDFFRLLNEPGKEIIEVKNQNYEVYRFQTSDGMIVSFVEVNGSNTLQLNQMSSLQLTLTLIEKLTNNLDFDMTIQTIFDEIHKVFPSDYIEVAIIDQENQEIKAYITNTIDGKRIQESHIRSKSGDHFPGMIITNKNQIWINDINNEINENHKFLLENSQREIRSIIGFPLSINDEITGSIVLGNQKPFSYLFDDQEIFSMIFKQISIAIHNAQLNQEVRRKTSEIGGLAKLTHSFSKIQEPRELFQNILTSFADLIPVEIFGFILFDDTTNILEAKKPFKGLPDPIVDILRTTIETDSAAEKIIYSQDILITDDAKENDHWQDLGLNHLANAASIQEAVLIPLAPASDPMGYILAANHHDGSSSFSQDEMHLLMIVANQTAPLIENLYLLIQSRQRTQRAEALRRISSIASSNATLDEVLAFAVNELSLLLHADFGGLFLIDQNSMKMEWKQSVQYGRWTLADQEGELLLSNPDFLGTVSYKMEPLMIGKFDETKPINSFYQKIIDKGNLQSAIAVPLVIKNQGIGELWFGSHTLSFFDQGDSQLILSAANQLAYVVDQANLSILTHEALREKIEQEKMVDELQKINQFSQKITSLKPALILNELLSVLVELIPSVDAGWIGLWDDKNQWLKPEIVWEYAESLSEIQFMQPSLPVEVWENKKNVIINHLDFSSAYRLEEKAAAIYLNASQNLIPNSCMIAPIISGDKSIGVIVLEIFSQDKEFTKEDESITLSFLQQTNLALENANLFKMSEQRTEQLKILSEISKIISSNLNREQLLSSLLNQLRNLIDYQNATLWEKEKTNLKIAATNGFSDQEDRKGIVVQIEDSALFQEMFQTHKPVVVPDIRDDLRFPSLLEVENLSWLGVPLISKKEIMGVIALEKKEQDFYTPELIKLVEAFASQAATALENAGLYEESIQHGAELNKRTQNLTWLNQFSTEVTRTLDMRLIAELTADHVSTILNCEMVFILLLTKNGQAEFITRKPNFDQSPILILENQPFFQTLLQTRGVYSIADISEENDIEILNEKFFKPRETKSVLFIPLLSSIEVLGWIGLESKSKRRFLHGEIELAMTIANQASLAINNASLLSETIGLKENLEERVEERTNELMIEHRNNEMLLNVSYELAGSMDIEQILTRTLDVINRSMNASGSLVHIREIDKLIQVFGRNEKLEVSHSKQIIEDFVRKIYETKSSLLVNELPKEKSDGFPYESLLFIPLRFGEVVLGALAIFSKSKDSFSDRDLKLAEAAAGQMSIALNNAEVFSLIQEQSENLGSMLRDKEVESSRSRAILEAVADGVLVTDTQSAIILLNKSAENILNINEKRIEKSLKGLISLYGDPINKWISKIIEWTAKPKNQPVGTIFTERILLGNEKVISVHLSPVIWRNEFLGTVSVFRDVSLEVQIDQLKTDFISNISHELRTPMTSIKGYVEVLLMGAVGAINEQQKHFLEIIQTNTKRLNLLVDDILDVSKIESGGVVLNPQLTDITGLIKKVIEEQQKISLSEKKQIEIEFIQNDPIPPVLIDSERIEQVLMNILNNARMYSIDKGMIKISLTLVEDLIKIDIKDKGIGVSKTEQDHIFERFYRGKNSFDVNSAGTGLGLSIAKTLVEMHGGKIWFESSGIKGEGSLVLFTIPINIAEENS